MDVRQATVDDGPRIEEIARSSLQTSYSLSPMEIDGLVEAYFAATALDERLDDSDTLVLVATDDDVDIDTKDDGDSDVVGFVEVDAEDAIRWLHVDPIARGRGIGSALVERAREELDERGVPVTARVLEAASEGRQFFEQFGLSQTGTTDLEVDGQELSEHVYTTEGEEIDEAEPSIDVPETVSVDDRELLVDRENEIPGTESPFFDLYEDESDDSRWGFLCGECGSTDVAADGLDRLECGECGNTHLAEQWDEAYL